MKLPVPTLPLVGYAALAGALIGGLAGWQLKTWTSQGRELIAVRSALASERASHEKDLKDLRKQVKDAQDASQSHLDELATLRARPVPTAPVRLCRESRPGVSSTAPSTTGIPEAAAGTGLLQPERRRDSEPGPDIGPELRALWREADELLALCRGAQRFLPR